MTSPYGPEVTGTLLAFHFINRVVSALLAPDLLPGGPQRFGGNAVRRVHLYARIARELLGSPSAVLTGAALFGRAYRGADREFIPATF